MSSSCSSSSASSSGSNMYQPEKPVFSAMTAKCIEMREKIVNGDNARYQQSLGPEHWSNIPPGSKFFEDFKRKFPNVVKQGNDGSSTRSNSGYQRPHPKTRSSIYEGTAFDPNYKNQNYDSQQTCYTPKRGDMATVVRQCRINEAIKHVDTAAFMLKCC